MSRKSKDYIEQKATELSDLNSAATSAIDMVTKTIKSLEIINQKRETNISEIQDYCMALMEVKQNLETGKKHDEAIIQNFKKLIEVE